MCKLLAFAFENSVRLSDFEEYFEHFISHSVKHKDGWGIAYFQDLIRTIATRSDGFRTKNLYKKATIVKEPQTALTSIKLKELEKESIESSIILAHIRMASCGDNTNQNTHPFSYTLENGNDIVFMHNGNLQKDKLPITIAGPRPFGETDSERAFIYLLGKNRREFMCRELQKTEFDSIKSTLDEIHELGNGPFNCIFSNGTYIFAYRDKKGERNLNFCQIQKEHKNGIIISTEPLQAKNAQWTEFEKGKLMVVRDGKIGYYG